MRRIITVANRFKFDGRSGLDVLGRRAAPGQHVSPPPGPKRSASEMN